MIDLRSDTVTRPSHAMRGAMAKAEVGDDMFGEDPTVNALQDKVARMFGKEAALFCSSGTQANQIAIKVHTQPGDQVICSSLAHIYHYEGGGIAMNSGCSVKLIQTADRGRFTADDIRTQINPEDIHFPKSRLVSLEDTVNNGGGAIWEMDAIRRISGLCDEEGLKLHVDGARLFNALVERGMDTMEYGTHFHSLSICLSKGLGAPVGSLLIGDRSFIDRARRVRKVFGGAMRQAGILAAAGIHALDEHVEGLKMDNAHAREIGELLGALPYVQHVLPVETNIVLFDMSDEKRCERFLEYLKGKGILAFATGPKRIRFVFHRDVDEKQVEVLAEVLRGGD